MSKNVEIVRLNEKWRIDDDPLQWILKRRDSAETYAADGSVVKPARWLGSAYCATRAALLSNIRERAGDVDPAAVAFIETWPEQHAHGAVPRQKHTARPEVGLRGAQVPEKTEIAPCRPLNTEAA